MSWVATERYEARTAPAGLALVQELINTHTVMRGGGRDLLADHASAEEWLRGAGRAWAQSKRMDAPVLSLPRDDVEALRNLRATMEKILAVPVDERPTGTAAAPAGATRGVRATLVSDEEGRVGIIPFGTGSGWLESALWSETLLAQQTGEWNRLKLCREPGCRSAFYDTSRNGSGVWHNVRTCGNASNLRAARSRKKQRAQAHTSHEAGPEPAHP